MMAYRCTVRIGLEPDGVMPIHCDLPARDMLVGNSTGHALCPAHVRTATRSTVNGCTTFHGPPIPEGTHVRPWVARDRAESDPCQCGTPGCCVDHDHPDAPDGGDMCDTW